MKKASDKETLTTAVELPEWVNDLPITVDQSDGGAAVLDRIIKATSLADILSDPTAEGLADMVGNQVTITGVKFRPSDFVDGLGVYAVIDIINLDTGEISVATTGSAKIIAQLYAMLKNDLLPATVIVDSKQSKNYAGRVFYQFVMPLTAEAF